MRTVLRLMVGVVGALFAVLGVRWMFTPEPMAAEQGISLTGAVALNTVRGDLGGMFLAGAILCVLGLRSDDGRWLEALALVVGCIAVGRAVGMLADGFAGPSLVAFGVELVMVGVLLGAARRAGAHPAAPLQR